jgi:hypothetical protein
VLFSLVQYDARSVWEMKSLRGCICNVASCSDEQGHWFYGAWHSGVCIHQNPSLQYILCQLSQVPSPNRRFKKGSEKDLALWNGLRHRSERSNDVVRCRLGSLAIKGTPCILIRSLLILFFHLQLCVDWCLAHNMYAFLIFLIRFTCPVHLILHFILLRMLVSVLRSPPSTLILSYAS